MSLWWIIGLALLIALIWMLARTSHGQASTDTPETILKRRYARGEIDREDYERRLQDLRK
jgi:putative membrane protein